MIREHLHSLHHRTTLQICTLESNTKTVSKYTLTFLKWKQKYIIMQLLLERRNRWLVHIFSRLINHPHFQALKNPLILRLSLTNADQKKTFCDITVYFWPDLECFSGEILCVPTITISPQLRKIGQSPTGPVRTTNTHTAHILHHMMADIACTTNNFVTLIGNTKQIC